MSTAVSSPVLHNTMCIQIWGLASRHMLARFQLPTASRPRLKRPCELKHQICCNLNFGVFNNTLACGFPRRMQFQYETTIGVMPAWGHCPATRNCLKTSFSTHAKTNTHHATRPTHNARTQCAHSFLVCALGRQEIDV